MIPRTLSGLSAVLICAVIFMAVEPLHAVQVKLSNGTVMTGEIVSQNDNFIVLLVGEAKVSVAKRLVTEITGLPAGTTVTGIGGQEQQPPATPPAAPAPSSAQTPAPAAPAPQPAAPTIAPADPWGAAPGNEVIITLKNGVQFKGTIVSSDDRLFVLQADNGSKVNVFKHIISDLRNLSVPRGPVINTSAQQAAAALAQKQAQNQAAAVPASPSPAPPAAALPAAAQPAPAPAAAAPAIVLPPAAVPAPVTPAPSAPAVKTPAVAPAPAAPLPEQKPVQQATALPPPKPAVPEQKPAVQPQPPAQAAPIAPAPAIVPAATAPAVAAPVAQPSTPAPVITPRKRPDGRSELLLKTGTVFIGTIVSESDRFLVFSTSDGTTINVLRRLIKEIDGVPYVIKPGAVQAPADTSAQLARTGRPQSAAPPAQVSGPSRVMAGPAVAPRKMPRVELRAGISAAELMDSLKSNSAVVRSAAARQLGAMGQWATGAAGPLAAMLGDTAGAAELPPLETDSVTIQKMLPPGFEAGRALARMGDLGFDELKRAARSGSVLTRQRALFGLGETQSISALPVLQEGLKDGEPRVRASAAHGLRFKDAVNDLVAALSDRDGDVRACAAATLAEMHEPRGTSALISSLKDMRPAVRMYSAEGLGKSRAREAVGPLIAALNDMSPEVRARAAAALGAIADTAAVNPLIAALKEKIAPVRKAAAEALGEIRDPRAIPSLYSALQESGDTVRGAIETSLRLHTEIPLLIGVLDHENSQVRENAAYILWLMTGQDLGQDKQAWVDWYAKGGSVQKKPPDLAKPPEKGKKKK
jgi:HEAT repeat protein/sRNA-binding regulator protein Hfq